MESSTGQDGKQRKLMRSASPADTGTLLPFQVLNGNEKKCRMRTEKKRFGVILQTAAFLDGISELASLHQFQNDFRLDEKKSYRWSAQRVSRIRLGMRTEETKRTRSA